MTADITTTQPSPEITDDGVYSIPDTLYHSDPVPGGSLSSSGARDILPPSCPAKFKWHREHAQWTRPMNFGTAVHTTLLGTGAPITVIDAPSYRTKKAQEQQAAVLEAGGTPLLVHEHEQVQAMAAKVLEHPIAGDLFAAAAENLGIPEASLFWTDPTGVRRRARVDWLPKPGALQRFVAVDYKTTIEVSPAAIARTVARYGYHCQDAWYCDGIRALGLDPDPGFAFVMQEKDPPYLVEVVQMDAEAVRIGRERNNAAIGVYAECMQTGTWPGYSRPDEIMRISLPRWTVREHEEGTWR